MKILPVIILLITITNSFAQKFEDRKANTQFLTELRALQNGTIPSIALHLSDSIKIKKLLGDKIDDRDFDRHPNGKISASQLKKITASSICKITDQYILLVLEDKYNQLRALTIRPDGQPIESILIYSDLLYLSKYWYEYEARRYSPTRAYHYDSITNEFTFSYIFKLMEPQYDEVLIDLKDHEDETTNRRKVKVNNEGFFTIPTYEHINSNKIEFSSFTIKSSFFQENSGKEIQNQSYDKVDKNFRIYLDRDQSMELFNNAHSAHDQIVRVIPKSKGKIEVYQQVSYGLYVIGDGDNCELKEPTSTSSWTKLEMTNDLTSLKKYTDNEQITPQISVFDLKSKIKQNCGDYHLSFTDHIKEVKDIESLVRPKEVTLKITFINTENDVTVTEYIVFVIANGC